MQKKKTVYAAGFASAVLIGAVGLWAWLSASPAIINQANAQPVAGESGGNYVTGVWAMAYRPTKFEWELTKAAPTIQAFTNRLCPTLDYMGWRAIDGRIELGFLVKYGDDDWQPSAVEKIIKMVATVPFKDSGLAADMWLGRVVDMGTDEVWMYDSKTKEKWLRQK